MVRTMSNKEGKRPHSEVSPETPPQEFSMFKMRTMMEELLDIQFKKMHMEEVKEDLKSLKKKFACYQRGHSKN